MLIALLAVLQTGATPAPCSCLADFDSLTSKLEADYVAFRMAVQGRPAEREYHRLVARLRPEAERANDEQCVTTLRRLTDWFRDGHLFITEYPTISGDSAGAAAAGRPIEPRSESVLRRELASRRSRLDPIEGIWYGGGYRVAVVRNQKPGRFRAIMLTADSGGWTPGQVRAEFRALGEGGYTARYWAQDQTLRHLDARIYRNQLLHMPPFTWGREWPADSSRQAPLDPEDPRRPTYRSLGGGVELVSVPSHSPEHRARLDSLIAAHREAMERARLLIVDVRGDEGGSAGTTDGLRPFYGSGSRRPSPAGPWRPMVLSSPDNIRYFQQSGWAPDSVVARMEAAPGAVIPLFRVPPTDDDHPAASGSGGPDQVAILMDRGTVSAGEAFVLSAIGFPRVTLFGEHTGGMIDYGNVTMVRLACRPRGLLFGYPMIANSPDLPAGALNPTGVVPDVAIDPSGGGIIERVIRYYDGRPARRAPDGGG